MKKMKFFITLAFICIALNQSIAIQRACECAYSSLGSTTTWIYWGNGDCCTNYGYYYVENYFLGFYLWGDYGSGSPCCGFI